MNICLLNGANNHMRIKHLSNETVLVAGGAGFIGSAIIRQLLNNGAVVVCFDNYLHGRPENVLGLEGALTVIQGDLLDPWTLMEALSEYSVSYIIHCAGDTYVPAAYRVPKRFFDVNLMGTLNLLMAAKSRYIRRVVYLSSTEVYGARPIGILSEDSPLMPVNTYAVSKLAADRLCATFQLEHDLPVVIARIFNSYGPRETHPYVIPDIITQLNRGNAIQLGNLEAKRDFTYVDDTADAIIRVMVSDIADGDVVNIGSNTSYSVEWIAEALAGIMGVRSLEIRHDPVRNRRFDIDHFQCNNEKLVKHTGWSPSVSINEGLRLTVDWFRSNGNVWCWESSTHDNLEERVTSTVSKSFEVASGG